MRRRTEPLHLAGAAGVSGPGVLRAVRLESRGNILLAVDGLTLNSLTFAPQAEHLSEMFSTPVRRTGAWGGYQVASIFAGARADHALKLLGDVKDGHTTSVGIYVAIAPVLTNVAVPASKRTRSPSLRPDCTVPVAHGRG